MTTRLHDYRDRKGRKLRGKALHAAVVQRALRDGTYDRLLRLQDGACALCRRTPTSDRRLDIDHDHETLEIRGLLCWKCNKFLLPGWVTPDLLRRAADYLEGEWGDDQARVRQGELPHPDSEGRELLPTAPAQG